MPTLRVFQVAKLLKVDSEEIFDALSDMGISVTSNLAPLDEAIVAELKELFKPKPVSAAKTPGVKSPVEKKPVPAAPVRKSAAAAKNAGPATAAGPVDPMQWWGALTKQFTTLAASAMKDTATDAAKTLAGTMVKQSADAAGQTLKQAAATPAKAVRKAAAKRRASSSTTSCSA